jgi:hypothetical protein
MVHASHRHLGSMALPIASNSCLVRRPTACGHSRGRVQTFIRCQQHDEPVQESTSFRNNLRKGFAPLKREKIKQQQSKARLCGCAVGVSCGTDVAFVVIRPQMQPRRLRLPGRLWCWALTNSPWNDGRRWTKRCSCMMAWDGVCFMYGVCLISLCYIPFTCFAFRLEIAYGCA